MKKFIGLVLLACLVFLGCPTDTNNKNDEKLVGKTITIEGVEYTFTADKVKVGGVEYDYTADGTTLKIPAFNINFTYSISESGITLTKPDGTSVGATPTEPGDEVNNGGEDATTTEPTEPGDEVNNDGENNMTKFEGTWEGTLSSFFLEYTFEGSNFVRTIKNGNDLHEKVRGTFTATGGIISFKATEWTKDGTTWEPSNYEEDCPYSFTADSKLKLTTNGTEITFTKK